MYVFHLVICVRRIDLSPDLRLLQSCFRDYCVKASGCYFINTRNKTFRTYLYELSVQGRSHMTAKPIYLNIYLQILMFQYYVSHRSSQRTD